MKKIITIFLGVCISIFFVSCSTPYYNQNSDLPNANNTKDFIHYEVEFDIPNEYTAYSTDNEFYTELIINDNIDVRKFKEENDNTDCDVYFTDEIIDTNAEVIYTLVFEFNCYDENDNLIDTIYFTDTLGDKQGIGGENVLSSTVNESVRKMKFSKAFLADLNEVQFYN